MEPASSRAPVQQPRVPILIAGAGERVTLRQVAEFADAANFGPNPHTGNVLDGDAVRRKFAVLEEHCVRVGRPYRVGPAHPLVAAGGAGRDGAGAAAKVAAISPDEHRFYGEHMVIGTPEEAIPHFQCLVDAGLQYFIVHTRADPDTARLLAERVLPALIPAPSPSTPTH